MNTCTEVFRATEPRSLLGAHWQLNYTSPHTRSLYSQTSYPICVLPLLKKTRVKAIHSTYSPLKPGGYYMTSLTFTNCMFCPHSVFMCFVWISEQTAIISLYNINRLGFITETECVYCAVRSLNTIHTDLRV